MEFKAVIFDRMSFTKLFKSVTIVSEFVCIVVRVDILELIEALTDWAADCCEVHFVMKEEAPLDDSDMSVARLVERLENEFIMRV